MSESQTNAMETRSVSDTESDGGERRLRRCRRKRGGGRLRPFEQSPEPPSVEEAENRKRSRIFDSKGWAPNNTTQFLLDDREARADADFENEQAFEAAERRRIRSMSGGYDNAARFTSWYATSEQGSSSGESEIDREMDREFETEYLVVKRERIATMSKPELEQELMERDHDAELLTEQLDSKEIENRHLRQLLLANGIALDGGKVSTTTPTVIQSTSPRVTAN